MNISALAGAAERQQRQAAPGRRASSASSAARDPAQREGLLEPRAPAAWVARPTPSSRCW
ncbi:MAG: hypothetical protein MZW92_55775 [Comamonadaceae bacterium]|nr:hypothetical protein [Comamonadaceae bacterium]